MRFTFYIKDGFGVIEGEDVEDAFKRWNEFLKRVEKIKADYGISELRFEDFDIKGKV